MSIGHLNCDSRLDSCAHGLFTLHTET
uniref:Uncharacterized protein n=1 Tax=Arundo donax TaxID=35708 RepID=A0A0A9C1M5_ARUDO